jgi:small subunit ribosomal protein S16
MAVKIRLKRTGATNNACYRVVAADSRSPRDGRSLENLGWYTPSQAGVNFKLKLERIDFWIGNGAQVSDTVASLIRKSRKMASQVVAEVETAPVVEEAPVVDATEEAAAVADAD